jgi:cysteinyl-tRNA synthetase
MKWPSPWGIGFPGWHIECSAMATKYLGERFDVHCGGVDHIPVHHTNEIAQSEACFGHTWVNYWLHGEFLELDAGKMSKSSGTFVHLDQLVDAGYSALDYRYLLLTAHYRSRLKFSYESLEASQKSRSTLSNLMRQWSRETDILPRDGIVEQIRMEFTSLLANDLRTSECLALAWKVARSHDFNSAEKLKVIRAFDGLFDLGLEEVRSRLLSASQQTLLKAREEARRAKDWLRADELRDELLKSGVRVRDKAAGSEWELI